jgi:hypothetical protein
MVDAPIKPDGQKMPQRGDIFALKFASGDHAGERAHVGFIYEVTGSPSNFQWRSAEGGQGPQSAQTMWISDHFRGADDGSIRILEGWKSLDDLSRDRAQCRKNNKP